MKVGEEVPKVTMEMEMGEEELDAQGNPILKKPEVPMEEEFSLESIVKELEEEASAAEANEFSLEEQAPVESDESDESVAKKVEEDVIEEDEVDLNELINELKAEYTEATTSSNVDEELAEVKKNLEEHRDVIKFLRSKLNYNIITNGPTNNTLNNSTLLTSFYSNINSFNNWIIPSYYVAAPQDSMVINILTTIHTVTDFQSVKIHLHNVRGFCLSLQHTKD
jgi:hypothetical protein